MTSEVFYTWLKKFSSRISQRPIVLLLDGHLSHVSAKVIRFAIDNNIILIKFPPHVTDILQPLDVSCFGPLKRKWSTLLSNRSSLAGNRRYLSKPDFVDELANMWFKCLTSQNVKSGFESTGIFPVDRSKYNKDRLNPRLLRRYSKWVDEGKEENVMEMATSLNTPKKEKTADDQPCSSTAAADTVDDLAILGPKPSCDPREGMEWFPT